MDPSLPLAVTKAIAYNENGGPPNLSHLKAGKSGEMKSIFQFEPSTWQLYAKEVTGNAKLPLTPDNEVQVVTEKVHKWLEAGDSPEQIMSMWNAGESQKDAYTGKFSDGQPSVGVNKEGVRYNVPGYVKNGMRYFQQLQPQVAAKVQQSKGGTPETAPPIVQGNQQQSPQANPLEEIMTALQSKVNPQSTPMASKKATPPIIQGQPQTTPQSKGLVAGMLPQYGQRL